MNKKELYLFLFTLSIIGYAWVLLSNSNTHVCIFKQLTSYPCPSCGVTRSVKTFLAGNYLEAVLINPLGVIVLTIMTFAPILIITDTLLNKEILFRLYKQTEVTLKQPCISIPLIILLLINWGWNIFKGL